MGGTKGYRSYRGRTSKGKIALAVLLVPALELVPEVSPQAAKVAHSRASAITMARIFLNFIQNSPSVFPEYKNL